MDAGAPLPTTGDALPVADEWWHVDEVDAGVFRLFEPAVHPLIRANVFLIKGQDQDLLVDGGLGLVSLRSELTARGLLDKHVVAVATHAHYDHTGSLHEFDDRRVHPAEAADLANATDQITLDSSAFDDAFLEYVAELGMPLPRLLLTAVPHAGFSIDEVETKPAPCTSTLSEGDVIDLGGRRFGVLHLPGHSPGGIGLWDEATGLLVAGDALYDEPLLDQALPGADRGQYKVTMQRLRALPARVVLGGHGQPFGRARMLELVDEYLEQRP